MAHNYIIQWNCRGLRSNREDIELLISKYSPAAICLQETLLTAHQTQTFKHYSAYYKSGIHGHGGSGRGSGLAGFDAPFNMGSARCKIEWNDNFEATYLKN